MRHQYGFRIGAMAVELMRLARRRNYDYGEIFNDIRVSFNFSNCMCVCVCMFVYICVLLFSNLSVWIPKLAHYFPVREH